MGRARNQDADALASECLKEVTIGAVKLQEPKMQGRESLQDVWCFLETGEPPLGLNKGKEDGSLERQSGIELSIQICSAKGGIKYSERCLPRRTSIVSSIPAIMTFAVDTLPVSSRAGKFCK